VSADLIAQADALLSSRQGRGVLSLADQRQPTRHTLRLALWHAFERARVGLPEQKRKHAIGRLGLVTAEERQERRDREEASRCIRCGAYPDGECGAERDGGLCRRGAA
jgi:hypothetical protein